MTETTATVQIPASVKDNSETVTDYAFMRHLSPSRGVLSAPLRDSNLQVYRESLGHAYTIYSWRDRNPNGQRCRFDMVIRNETGGVVSLMHTEYWTRVACHAGEWCYSYATRYVLAFKDGKPTTDDPLPYCGEHFHKLDASLGVQVSERLLIGQHD